MAKRHTSFQENCRSLHIVRTVAYHAKDRTAHVLIHAVMLGIDYFSYANLGDFDAASQAGTSRECQPISLMVSARYKQTCRSTILNPPLCARAQLRVMHFLPHGCISMSTGQRLLQSRYCTEHLRLSVSTLAGSGNENEHPPALQFLRFLGVPL